MDQDLQSIVLAFGILNAISFIFSLALFVHNKKIILFRLNCAYWASMVVLFLAQGILGQTDSGIIASFCFTPLYVFVLAKISQELFKLELPIKNYLFVLISGVTITLGLCLTGANFTFAALPNSIAAGGVLIHTSYTAFSRSNANFLSMTGKLFLFVVFICGLHVLDFPFLRQNNDFAILGFYIAFLLSIFMSVILPYFVAEETQRNYLENLEEQVNLKTIELNKANTKLNELAIERQDLILLICHDLNNHLMIQLHFNEYLKDLSKKHDFSKLDQKFALKLSRSQNVLETQKNLTAKINLMSSIETGKVNLTIGEVNLSEAISSSLSLLENKLLSKEIQVHVNCSASLVARADKTLLINSVLNNIIVNAIKFSHMGGILQIRAFSKDKEVWLVIKDYGVGIPQPQIPHLFSRTKATTTRGTSGESGTGFGMPIVYSMMQRFGGNIIVRSSSNLENEGISGTSVCLIFQNMNPDTALT